MNLATKIQEYGRDPATFRRDLLVDVDGLPRRFGVVMDDWQKEDFAALDPALLACTGQKKVDAAVKMRAFLERARGHSKTTDLAVTCCYALAFATRPLRGYCYAADKDQAQLLRDAMQTILRLNPWLAKILVVQRDSVTNVGNQHPGEGASLSVNTSDVGSSYGILPDFIIADELCHWQGDGGLWDSLISSAAKRKNCLFVVITNSGFVDSWQWKVREVVRTDGGWHFSRLDGPKASWMTDERLQEQRKMLPPVAYARLWLNQWSTGGGDALTQEDIEFAFSRGTSPMTGYEPGYTFVAGVDLGLKRDCSAIVVLGVRDHDQHDAGTIRLAYTKLWKPVLGTKINLTEVEDELRSLHQRFKFKTVAYDFWQAEHLSQRLKMHDDLPMFEVSQSGSNLQAMARTMIESFTDKRMELYEEANLKRDLLKLRVEERAFGYRLVSPRDETGHGDTASAFSLALLVGHEQAGKKPAIATAFTGDVDDDPMWARHCWSHGYHPDGHKLNDF